MQFLAVCFLVLFLALPALLCCFIGGWHLAFGLLALSAWAILGVLILCEWWSWYKLGDNDDENP